MKSKSDAYINLPRIDNDARRQTSYHSKALSLQKNEISTINPLEKIRLSKLSNETFLPCLDKATPKSGSINKMKNSSPSLSRLKPLSHNNITKEFTNLEKLSVRGTLAPTFDVLPPIHGKRLNLSTSDTPCKSPELNKERKSQRKSKRSTRAKSKEVKHDFGSSTEHRGERDDKMEAIGTKKPKPKQQHIQPEDESHQETNDMTGRTEEKNVEMSGIETNMVHYSESNFDCVLGLGTFVNDNENKITTVPSMPNNINSSNKAQQLQAERELSVNMISWARFHGRRNAICFEIDEVYRDLATIVKHNLLVQYLEEIWMC